MNNQFDERKDFVYENGFYLTSKPYRIGNLIAHYELYKKITTLPGALVELGVFRGSSMIQWATFRELLENENSRKLIGFDAFGEFPDAKKLNSDEKFVSTWNRKFEGSFLSKDELYEYLELKDIHNVELIQGNILETLPRYLDEHGELRVSLLHIDTDVYEPCKSGLELLFDRVVPSGIIVFDDYSVIEGETKAVDEFFENRKAVFRKFPFSHAKPTYMIKD